MKSQIKKLFKNDIIKYLESNHYQKKDCNYLNKQAVSITKFICFDKKIKYDVDFIFNNSYLEKNKEVKNIISTDNLDNAIDVYLEWIEKFK